MRFLTVTVRIVIATFAVAVLASIGWAAGLVLASVTPDPPAAAHPATHRTQALSDEILDKRFAYLLRSAPNGLVLLAAVKGTKAIVVFNVDQWDSMSDDAQRAEILRAQRALYVAWTDVNGPGSVPVTGLDLYIESRGGSILSYTELPARPTPLDGAL